MTQVVVLDYYQIIPPSSQFSNASIFPDGKVDPVCWGLSHNLNGAYNDAIDIQSALNFAIAGAVVQAEFAGVTNVTLVDISNLENEHGICTRSPALFSGELMNKTQFYGDVAAFVNCHTPLIGECSGVPAAEQDLKNHTWRVGHPNVFGQRDIAHTIEASLGS